jgi:uncharacterized membrane protein YphA (DoxX/SURF4 family)
MGPGMSLTFLSKTKIVTTGRIFFALGMVVIGGQNFFFRQFSLMIVPHWPQWISGQGFWACLLGTFLIAAGLAILTGIKARMAALLLGALFLFSFLFLHVPANVMVGVTSLGGWTSALKAFTLAGCSLVIAGTFPQTSAARGPGNPIGWLEKLIPYGMYALAIQVILFGICHFLYISGVATLVPTWVPGHIFWTYFAGTALIASGVGMITGVQARLAATLLGAMIFVWVLVLHIPRAIADPYSDVGNELTSAFEALAKSGVAFILGETLAERERRLTSKKSFSRASSISNDCTNEKRSSGQGGTVMMAKK